MKSTLDFKSFYYKYHRIEARTMTVPPYTGKFHISIWNNHTFLLDLPIIDNESYAIERAEDIIDAWEEIKLRRSSLARQ